MDDRRFLELSADYLGEYVKKIRGSVERLSEEQIWWRPNDASNSVGNLLLHLCGNLSQWVLASLGDVAYERRREAEFSARQGPGKAELLARIEEVVASSQKVIRGLSGSQLVGRLRIQGLELDGGEAVYHAVEHMSYHTGQIAFIAKQRAGRDLALG